MYLLSCANAAEQCPNLSNPAQWKLENHFIKYDNQMWYVANFSYLEQMSSGTSLPVPIEHKELTKAKSITLSETLPTGDCLYIVKTLDYPPAELALKRMGK
jgi:hypothetical protein